MQHPGKPVDVSAFVFFRARKSGYQKTKYPNPLGRFFHLRNDLNNPDCFLRKQEY